MNILVNGFHDERQIDVIGQIVSAVRPAALHWITTKACEDSLRQRFPEAVLLFWEDLFWGIKNPAGLEGCLPLDARLVAEMAPYETVALRMMDRFCFKRDYSYSERKSVYLDYLRFWNDYVERNNIDFFLSQNVPHEVFDFVLLGVCDLKNLKTLMFYQSQINDLIVPMRMFDSGVIGLDEALQALAKGRDGETSIPDHVEGDLQRLLAKQQPFYMSGTPLIKSAMAEIRRVATAIVSSEAYYRKKLSIGYLRYRFKLLRRKMEIRNTSSKLAEAYNVVAAFPVPGESYVYLALHYQPELTTSPLAGAFVDQGLVIEMLAASLPDDVKVYVKEHPKQTAIGRDASLYSRYSAYGKVRFISNKCSSFDLMDGAFCVATCTGTAGWEAIVRGKSVLVFGDIFFDQAPGAYRIRTQEDMKKAFGAIQRDGDSVGRSTALRNFLAALAKVSIYGFCDPVYEAVSTTDFPTSNANIADYVLKYLQDDEGGEP